MKSLFLDYKSIKDYGLELKQKTTPNDATTGGKFVRPSKVKHEISILLRNPILGTHPKRVPTEAHPNVQGSTVYDI